MRLIDMFGISFIVWNIQIYLVHSPSLGMPLNIGQPKLQMLSRRILLLEWQQFSNPDDFLLEASVFIAVRCMELRPT